MLTHLEWLPPPGDDFRQHVQALRKEISGGIEPGMQARAVALAQAALNETQLTMLARLAGDIRATGAPIDGLSPVKLAIVGDGTLSLCTSPIIGAGLRHGLLLDVVEGGYNSAVQEAMDPSGPLHGAGLDMALLAPDARILGLDRAAESVADADAKVDAAMATLEMIVEALRPAVAAAMLVQTVPAPLEPLFGSFDRVYAASPFAMVETLNRRIADWAAGGAITLVDIARLAASVGLEHWHDPRHWHASKLAFAPDLIPLYADVVTRTVAALRGRSRKCLVLDLDNTIWGGVIGDDGLAGIEIGQGTATGEAFLTVQTLALALRERGVILAVCSKNEEDAARLPFREHPDMVLREEHIAVFQANWTDKAANLRAIAQTLNIGLDALVLLDDNPAERKQVRDALPLVAAPELPDDPALYCRTLAAAGYFEAVAFSQEDRERAGYYQANARRAAVMSSASDLSGYLASLEMVCGVAEVDAMSRARVAQLINKSNQFNLTTRRYSESEVEAAERDPARHAIQIRLTDRFGDNGIITVIIADKGAEAWEIDTWLMSCRVLGRRVQEAALAHLAAAAGAHGARALIGRYRPSAKNRMVAEHYRDLGFARVEVDGEDETVWRLELANYTPPDLPMRVEDATRSKTGAST